MTEYTIHHYMTDGTTVRDCKLHWKAGVLPRDTAVIYTGVRLAAGGAGRLLWWCCSAARLAVTWGMCRLAKHGHALHLLQVGMVLPWRGFRAPIAMMRTHLCPMAVLHRCTDYLL